MASTQQGQIGDGRMGIEVIDQRTEKTLTDIFYSSVFEPSADIPIIDGVTYELFGECDHRRSMALLFLVETCQDPSDLFAEFGGKDPTDAEQVLLRGAWLAGLSAEVHDSAQGVI